MDSHSTTPPPTPPDPTAPDRAREYEALQNRFFLVRILMTLAALAVYLFSGASAALAAGLESRFAPWWPVVNGFYIFITVFGFAAFMFPVSLYTDHTLEHRYGLSKQSLESWLLDFLKALALELGLAVVFFELVYALLRWTPGWWWGWAAAAYVLFAIILTAVAPVLIMPLFYKFEPLRDMELAAAAKEFVQRAGLQVVGVYQWGLDEKTVTTNAALAGLGRTRRIILGDTLLAGYTREEILAVLAHEVGHYRNRDLPRMIAIASALAVAGLFLAHLALHSLVARFGFAGPGDIAAFPIFVFCLFVFSLVTLPLTNACSRRLEYAADAHAVRELGSAAPLVSALEKMATQNLADRNPAPWIEFLLHSHPSIDRRIRRARAVAASAPRPPLAVA